MSEDRKGQHTFGTQLARTRDTPVRLAFATLVGSNRFWIGYVIGLPVVALTAAFIHQLFTPFAAGVPVGICLLLLWLSHEFIAPCLVVDTQNRTLTISKPYGRDTYSSIDTDDIERVSLIQLGQAALVNVHYRQMEFSKPYSTAVDAADIHALETRLEQMGVCAHVRGPASTLPTIDAIRARVVTTPVVIAGSIVTVWQAFGSTAFLTDAVVDPAIVLIGYTVFSFWQRHIRH